MEIISKALGDKSGHGIGDAVPRLSSMKCSVDRIDRRDFVRLRVQAPSVGMPVVLNLTPSSAPLYYHQYERQRRKRSYENS